MKFYLNKTSSFALAIGLFFSASLPSISAEEPPAEMVERYGEALRPAMDRDPLNLRVYRAEDERRSIWHIALESQRAPDEPICFSTLPIEAGAEFYEFKSRSLSLDESQKIYLLETRPIQGEGPMDPRIYQLAFHLKPGDGPTDWRCRNVGRGEYTQLDGGARLSLEEVNGETQLTRVDAVRDVGFCGNREGEDSDREVFNPETGRFTAAHQGLITDEDATTLTAEFPDPPATAPLTEGYYLWTSATSDIRGGQGAVRRPQALGDLNLSTAWIEGTEGLGMGDFATARLNGAAPLRSVRIFPGHGASREAFEGYARPTRLLFSIESGDRFVIDLPEVDFEGLSAAGGVVVDFPEPQQTRCLSVMILDAEPGNLTDHTDPQRRHLGTSVAIAEITPFSIYDGANETDTARRIVAMLRQEQSAEQRDRVATLGALIPDAMIAAVSAALREDDGPTRRRLVGYLGQTYHHDALEALLEHYLRITPEDADYLRTKRAIAAHGTQAAPALLQILPELDPSERKYVDTVRTIGRVGSDIHRIPLIAQLGEGSDFLRSERIRAIANGGSGVIPRLLTKARTAHDSPAGLDALTTLVFIGQRRFSQEQADVDQAVELRKIYLDSASRAHQIRALEAMGYFPHPDAEVWIDEEVLSTHPDPVVRSFGVKALESYRNDHARRALERALRDDSPDVRIAAIRALNRREDALEATPAAVTYLRTETWPRGLHHGLHLLARSPDPEAQQAIGELIREDITSSSSGTALRALRRAERPLLVRDIEELLAHDQAPLGVLDQLIHMLGLTADEPSSTILIAITDGAYPPLSEIPDRAGERIVQRAFMALGTSRTDAARDHLLAVASDDARPLNERIFALRGLGFYFDRALLEQLEILTDELPPELLDQMADTLAAIQSRLAIEDAGEEVESIMRRIEEDLQRREQEDSGQF